MSEELGVLNSALQAGHHMSVGFSCDPIKYKPCVHAHESKTPGLMDSQRYAVSSVVGRFPSRVRTSEQKYGMLSALPALPIKYKPYARRVPGSSLGEPKGFYGLCALVCSIRDTPYALGMHT